MRQILPLWLSFLIVSLVGAAHAQEPSAALRQADADYREGVAALNRNDLETARNRFAAVTQLAPSAEQGHSALGAVLVRQGQWAAGTRELEKALALKPNDGGAQLNLAMVYAQTGAHAKAIPLFANLEAASQIDHHPLSVNVLEAYARSLQATGQTRRALAQMKQAVALESRNAELHDELGSLYAMERDWALAEQAFSEAVELKDDLASAHLHLALVLEAERKPGVAEEYAKAYFLAPGDPVIVLAMGKALADAGRDSEAVPVLGRAVQLQPRSAEAAYQLAIVLQRVDRVPEAIDLLRKVVLSEPTNAAALTNLGMALAQMHKATEGVAFLKKAVTIDPADSTAHQDLAAAYIQINQIDDAVVELKAAIKLSPDSPQLHYDLGTAYKLQDNATDAIPELETAAKLDPAGYEPPYVLGLLYMQAARYRRPREELELSFKLHPKNGEGWATLGSVYNKLDRFLRRPPHYAKPLGRCPTSRILIYPGRGLDEAERPAQGPAERKIAANLMRTQMNLQRAEVATNSGKSLLSNGKLDEAIVQFRDALTFDPQYH